MNELAFKELIDQYVTGNLSHENRATFALLLEQPEYQSMLEAELERSFMDNEFEGTEPAERRDRLNKLIFEKIQPQPAVTVHRIHFLRRSWVRIAVAAVILLLLGSVVFYTWLKPDQPNVAATAVKPATDMAPGGNKASLTLSDGSVIVLDSTANGALAQQGNVQVIKSDDGQLTYKPTTGAAGAEQPAVVYNILTTPRGGQYQLVLPDGTKVWLNAASSIRYPAAFTEKERKVEITGEAYFEVATLRLSSGHKKPFIVAANGTEVTVLGTHFNVNTYGYENSQRITLLEGSVKVVNGEWSMVNGRTAILKPGEQAEVARNSPLSINHSPDLDEVMAWKNGKFSFGETADIRSVMNQVADWYDMDIVYKGNIDKHISGTISRNVTLLKLLEMLKTTGVVDFNIKGKTLEVIAVK